MRVVRTIGLRDRSVTFPNGTVVEAPPFAGEVSQWSGGGRGLRAPMLPAERDLAPQFEQAIREAGLEVQETIHLEVAATATSMRGPSATTDEVVIKPAPPPGEAVQIILYQDESGGLSWHFPDGFVERRPSVTPEARHRSALRSSRNPSFTIKTRTVAARSSLAGSGAHARLRGPVTKLARKIFKVIVAPIAALIGDPVEKIVAKIEKKHRNELVRAVTADNYKLPVTTPFTDWQSLQKGPALLLVHGIFSSTDGMLSRLPRPVMERLVAKYDGRVIAYDQLTASRSPEENAKNFLNTVAANAKGASPLHFDVVCHSRGGIVSRTLAERGRTLVPKANCLFDRVFFVATPNQGSPLGDPEHLVEMIDVFTNWSTNFPDGAVSYSIEVVLSLVKLLAYTVASEVPGVAAMGTGKKAYINRVLNASTVRIPTLYGAAASNYEPDPSRDNGFFCDRVADWALDKIFERAANDLVVPCDGVFGKNGHPSFPISNPLRYAPDDAVWHTDFFSHEQTTAEIIDFLGRPLTTIKAKSTAIRVSIPEIAYGPVPDISVGMGEGTGGGFGELAGGGGAGFDDIASDFGLGADVDFGAPSLGRAASRGGARIPVRATRGVSVGRKGGSRSAAARSRSTGATRMRLGRNPRTGTAIRVPVKKAKKAGAPKRTRRRPAAAAPPPPATDTLIEREPQIDFHEQVQVGAKNELVVRLSDLVTAGAAGNVVITVPDEAKVSVILYAPGFKVEPSAHATLTVKRDREPQLEETTFDLTARACGKQPVRRSITAEFWHRNGLIGTVTHNTVVVPKDFAGAAPSDGSSKSDGFVLERRKRDDCDLVVRIEGRNDPGVPPFDLTMRSTIPGEEYEALFCGALNLPSNDLAKYFDSTLDDILAQQPDLDGLSEKEAGLATAQWNADFCSQLEDLGKRLWGFLPEKFRTEYFRLYGANAAPRSVLVHSDELVFPWELVVPYEKIGNRFVQLQPLGVTHILGRWRPNMKLRPSRQQMAAHSFVLLRPKYTGADQLPWAEYEEQLLKKHLGAIEVPAANATEIKKLVKRNDVHFLHFSGHGAYQSANADLSELVLENNGRITALSLAATPLGMEAQPILYLNACSVGATALTVGRPGGFVSACLDGGFSGVIAPYWPINDESAARFSSALYERLIRGRAIGEALQELRQSNPGDPTFRAYAYFGDPWTRVDFAEVVKRPSPAATRRAGAHAPAAPPI